MTIKGREVGKGHARRIVPLYPKRPPPAAERADYEADRREWLQIVSAATTFDGVVALAEEEARSLLETGGPGAQEQAWIALEKIAWARADRDQGNIDSAMRWAFEAGRAVGTMWAVARTGADARTKREEKRAAVPNPRHEHWCAKAREIWKLHSDLGASAVARRVCSWARKADEDPDRPIKLTADVETVRKVIASEKPGRR